MKRPVMLVVVLVSLVATSAASAFGEHMWIGPALSGESSLGYRLWQRDPDVQIAAPGTSGRTLISTPDPNREFVQSLTATAHRVVYVRGSRDGRSSAWQSSVMSGTPAGGFAEIERSAASSPSCFPLNVALTGDTLLEARGDCSGNEIAVRDLASEGGARPLPWNSGGHYIADGDRVSAAGHYAAWIARGTPNVIVVYDLAAEREVYRVDLTPYIYYTTFEVNYDLDDDGTVVLQMIKPDSHAGPADLDWFSPVEPYAHHLPDAYGIEGRGSGAGFAVAIHHGLIAYRRYSGRDWAVIDLQGRVHNVFDYNAVRPAGIDFDGRRIVWQQAERIHNEAYPVIPEADVPSSTLTTGSAGTVPLPVWCSTSDSSCTGSVAVEAAPSVRGASAARRPARFATRSFKINARKTARVTLKLSTAAKRALAHHHSIRVRAVVASRGKHGRTQSVRALIIKRRHGR
jgi:hypothetical protein